MIPVVLFAVHYGGLMLTPCFRLDPKLVKNMKQKDKQPEAPTADTELVRVV